MKKLLLLILSATFLNSLMPDSSCAQSHAAKAAIAFTTKPVVSRFSWTSFQKSRALMREHALPIASRTALIPDGAVAYTFNEVKAGELLIIKYLPTETEIQKLIPRRYWFQIQHIQDGKITIDGKMVDVMKTKYIPAATDYEADALSSLVAAEIGEGELISVGKLTANIAAKYGYLRTTGWVAATFVVGITVYSLHELIHAVFLAN